MSMNDLISDMIARIRNSQMRGRDTVRVRASKMCGMILDVMTREGFLSGYDLKTDKDGWNCYDVSLKYYSGKPVLKEIKRVSKPGLRCYVRSSMLPFVNNGLGIAIVSTSLGMLTDAQAREKRVGGEVICTIF